MPAMPCGLLRQDDVQFTGLCEQFVGNLEKTVPRAGLFRFPTRRDAAGGHLPQKLAVHL
jgi:hypothetical protein